MSENNKLRGNENRRYTIGIVGMGAISHYHVEAIDASERFEWVAACDVSAQHRQEIGCRLKPAGVFDDYRKMLEADFDVLVICLPHHLHAPVAIEALRAGKHVLVEKPMALSVDESRQMLDASRGAQRHLMVAETSSFEPGAILTGQRFRSGQLGRFLCSSIIGIREYFHAERPAWYLAPSQSGGGMFANVGVHRLAMVRAALPTLRPRFVTASVNTLEGFAVEACTHAMVQYADGGSVTYELVGYFPCPGRIAKAHHVVFERGIACWDAERWELVGRDGNPLEQRELEPDPVRYRPVYSALMEMLDGTYSGPRADEYAEDLAVVQAIEKSAALNRRIDLAEEPQSTTKARRREEDSD